MADAKIRIKGEDDTAAAFRSASNNLNKFKSSADGLVTSLGSLLGAGGVISVVSLGAFAKFTLDGVDALNDLKDATGASIENLSALEDVAARTGTSFGNVESALVKFNGVLNKAEPDSAASQALKAIGLEADALKRLDPAEALRQTAVALATFADDGNKARIVQELFGKSVKEVAPFLKDLAEQSTLVATVTTKSAEEAEKFNKELFNMQKNTVDLARYLTSDLVTAINATIEKFREGKKEGKSFFEVSGKQYTDWVRDFYGMKPASTGGASGSFAPDEAPKPSLPSFTPSSKPKSGGSGVSKKADVDDSARSLATYVARLERATEKTADFNEVQKAQNFLLGLGKLGQVDQVRELVLGMAAREDAAKAEEAMAQVRSKAAEASSKYIESLNEENNRLAANVQGQSDALEEMGLTAEALGRLKLARLDNALAMQRERVAMVQGFDGNEQELIQLEKRIELMQQERDIVGRTATKVVDVDQAEQNKKRSEGLAQSIEEGILTGFRGGKSMADVFLDELQAQFAKTVLRPIIQPIADAGSQLISTALASLLSFDGGGYTGSGARSGGIDGKGGFMAVMHPNETVTDHTKGGSAGGVTVYQNFTVGDVASISMVRQAVAGSERRISASMGRSMGYGGDLA